MRLMLSFKVATQTVLILALMHATPAIAQIELRFNRVVSYAPHFPIKRKMNHAYRPELNEMKHELHARMEKGENLNCAAHIYEEIHWLINYTDEADEIERRMKQLRGRLDDKDAKAVPRQDPADGSFGACFDSWIWRFFRSVDPLKELAREGKQPEHPLKIWEPVDTPEEIEALMKGLLTSDLSTGYNKRKELNLAITALGQLLWLDYTAAVFPKHLDRKILADTLKNFVDENWQDEETGYWGAWYQDGNILHKTNDLSITFHILSYRGGDVKHLNKIAGTTAAIRNVNYPYGWQSDGIQNNHHAYDIARIINLTWDDLDAVGRAQAASELFIMVARSLALSINEDGAFDPSPYTTVGEAYYFGVSFFIEAGLLGRPSEKVEVIKITNTEGLLERLAANLETLDKDDPWVAATFRKLDDLKN